MARLAVDVDVFSAMGEPARRRIVEVLREGDRPVGQIARLLAVAQPSVSKHLRVLVQVGLVRAVPRGRERVYQLQASGLAPMHAWVSQFEALWAGQAERIKRAAELRQKQAGQARPEPTHRGEPGPGRRSKEP